MTDEGCSELCLVFAHGRITLAVANERINPLVSSHLGFCIFLANYMDQGKEELTMETRVLFLVSGEHKEPKVACWRLAFVFRKTKQIYVS